MDNGEEQKVVTQKEGQKVVGGRNGQWGCVVGPRAREDRSIQALPMKEGRRLEPGQNNP